MGIVLGKKWLDSVVKVAKFGYTRISNARHWGIRRKRVVRATLYLDDLLG